MHLDFTPVPGIPYATTVFPNPAPNIRGLGANTPPHKTAVCALWTPVGRLAQVLDDRDAFGPEGWRGWAGSHASTYLIGPCYSARGAGFIIRTLLANPQITRFEVRGADNTGTADILRTLLLVDWAHLDTDSAMWPPPGTGLEDVPPEALVALGARAFDFAPFDKDNSAVDRGTSYNLDPQREPQIFPAPPPPAVEDTYRGDPGIRVVGQSLAQVWPLVLAQISDHGAVSATSYGSKQKECAALTWVIRDSAKTVAEVPSWMTEALVETGTHFDHAEAVKYGQEQLLSAEPPTGTAYTYGQQMRAVPNLEFDRLFNEGADEQDIEDMAEEGITPLIDQYAEIVKLLQDNPEQRRCWASTWDRAGSLLGKSPPCLTGLWLRRDTDGSLMLWCVFRSHDMFKAFPGNIFGLSMLLRWFAWELGMTPGVLCGVSLSAHLYDDCWEIAGKVSKRGRGRIQWDARSAFNVYIDPDGHGQGAGIIAERMSPDGTQVLTIYTDDTATAIIKAIERDGVITTVGHAFWLAQELAAAEQSLG